MAQVRPKGASIQSLDLPLSTGYTVRSREDKMEHEFELTDPVPQTPYDSTLLGGHTPKSDEGSMTLKELTDLYTTLLQNFLDLENVKTAQAKEITSSDSCRMPLPLSFGSMVGRDLNKEARIERKRQEASKAALSEMYNEVQAQIDADHKLAVRLTHEEQEKYTIKERSKLLAKFFERRKKQLAKERAGAIRSKPPIKT
nr:hypothetical protein [Tanacetum cinerariifolium]